MRPCTPLQPEFPFLWTTAMLAAFFEFSQTDTFSPISRPLPTVIPALSSVPFPLLALVIPTPLSGHSSNVTFLDTSDQLRSHVNVISTSWPYPFINIPCALIWNTELLDISRTHSLLLWLQILCLKFSIFLFLFWAKSYLFSTYTHMLISFWSYYWLS